MPGETFIGSPWRQPYTAKQLSDAAANQVPIIGNNGNFWRWDIESGQFVDTGVAAGAGLADGQVTTPKLADGSVTWPKLSQEARHSNPNLLDNWYFVGGGSQQGGGQFPINQRGLTEYTAAGYTIDRWRMHRDAKLTLASDSILLYSRPSSGVSFMSQRLENPSLYYGETLTFSVLVEPQAGSNGGAINIGKPSYSAPYAAAAIAPSGLQLVTATAVVGPEFDNVYITVNYTTPPAAIKLIAAKLELGPNQTLAHESAGGVGLK